MLSTFLYSLGLHRWGPLYPDTFGRDGWVCPHRKCDGCAKVVARAGSGCSRADVVDRARQLRADARRLRAEADDLDADAKRIEAQWDLLDAHPVSAAALTAQTA